MSYIFISYSREDETFILHLASLLKDEGFTIWLDKERLDTGEIWSKELKEAITDCDAFIIVMSPDAEESKWVQNELRLAEKLKKPILPIHLRGEIWWSLSNIQVEDMKKGLEASLSPSFVKQLHNHVKYKTMSDEKQNNPEQSISESPKSQKNTTILVPVGSDKSKFDLLKIVGMVGVIGGLIIQILLFIFGGNGIFCMIADCTPQSPTPITQTPVTYTLTPTRTLTETALPHTATPTETPCSSCEVIPEITEDPALSNIANQRSEYLSRQPTSELGNIACLNQDRESINYELDDPDVMIIVLVKNGEITDADIQALIPPEITISAVGIGNSENMLSGNSYHILILASDDIPDNMDRCHTSLP